MTDRLAIIRDRESPPGGWRYTVKETGLVITAPYANQIRQKILAHMEANSIPIPVDYEEWIDDELCRENGHGSPWCGAPPPKPVPGRASILSVSVAKRFLRSMLHIIKDRQFVEEEEAQRRAAICMACPLAMEIGGCWGCGSILKTLEKSFPENPIKTPKDKSFCGACGCAIRYKAWIPNETLNKAEKEKPDYHPACWRWEGEEPQQDRA